MERMLVSEDNARIEAVLEWWFGEPPLQPQAKWFRRSKATDAEIAERFGAEHEIGRASCRERVFPVV